MGEYFCKPCMGWGVNIQNIHKIFTTQQQNHKQSDLEMAKHPNRHLFKEDMQMAKK